MHSIQLFLLSFLRASFLLSSGNEKKISHSDFLLLLTFFFLSWLCLFLKGIESVRKLRKQFMDYLDCFFFFLCMLNKEPGITVTLFSTVKALLEKEKEDNREY